MNLGIRRRQFIRAAASLGVLLTIVALQNPISAARVGFIGVDECGSALVAHLF